MDVSCAQAEIVAIKNAITSNGFNFILMCLRNYRMVSILKAGQNADPCNGGL
jgi:hypothetical protein